MDQLEGKTAREKIVHAVLFSKKWRPAQGSTYYYYKPAVRKARKGKWQGDSVDLTNFAVGNVKRTLAGAKAWGRKYGAAFRALGSRC